MEEIDRMRGWLLVAELDSNPTLGYPGNQWANRYFEHVTLLLKIVGDLKVGTKDMAKHLLVSMPPPKE